MLGKRFRDADSVRVQKRSRKHGGPKELKALSAKEQKAVRKIVDNKLKQELELKFIDGVATAITGDPVGNSDSAGNPTVPGVPPFVSVLSIIPQNDTGTGRDGKVVRPKFVGVRYSLQGSTAAPTDNPTEVRVMLVQINDSQDASVFGAAAIWASIIEPQERAFGYRRLNDTGRYNVLYDARHVLSNAGGNEDFETIGEISVTGGLGRINYETGDTTGFVATGHLFFIASCTANPALNLNTMLPKINWVSRVRFTDA